MKELNLILIVLTGIAIAQWIKWKIVSLALIYYMNKRQYEWPNDDEMKSCTDFVTKNMAKDLFGSKTKGGL